MTRSKKGFGLRPGDPLGDDYVVESRLGRGWEGEVYRVVETRTKVRRAAKLFYPKRNVRDRAVRIAARKLDRLRDCAVIVQYKHSERVELGGEPVTVLVSELVEGVLLERLIRRQPGRRFRAFEALHLVHAIAQGLEEVHELGEYHGDVHVGNVLVRRRGIRFQVRLVDVHHWGRPSPADMREDVINLVRVLYDCVGGQRWYPSQPPEIREVCLGLRRDLIAKKFPRAGKLRAWLERFPWEQP